MKKIQDVREVLHSVRRIFFGRNVEVWVQVHEN